MIQDILYLKIKMISFGTFYAINIKKLWNYFQSWKNDV